MVLVAVDFISADEFVTVLLVVVLLAVGGLLVGELLLVAEVLLLLIGVDELLFAVGELIVEV